MTISARIALAAVSLAALMGGQAHAGALPKPDKVVVVMMENKDFNQIVGSSYAPFINDSLIKGGLLYTNSHAIEHPSQPNYLDFFSGSNQGVNSNNGTLGNAYNFPAKAAFYAGLVTACQANPSCTSGQLAALTAAANIYAAYAKAYGTLAVGDAFPKTGNFFIPADAPFTTPNLASELAGQGKTFVEYSDGLAAIAGATDAGGNAVISVINNPSDPFSVGYAHRHDPVADWMSANPTGNQLAASAEQDFGNFGAGGLDFSTLPDVSLVVPDTIHDMHDGAINAAVANGDGWLAANLANYLAWAKTHNSLLILTTDENDFVDPSNRILTVINGYSSLFSAGTTNQYINHFSVLRTLEDIYGAGHAGASAEAQDLWSAGGVLGVPEPATWTMMLLGLGLAGGAVRSRRRLAAA